jgi:hypothetical protein
MDFNRINLRYRDILEELGVHGVVSDGDMWDRVSELMKLKNINGELINKVTCAHLEEGYSLVS